MLFFCSQVSKRAEDLVGVSCHRDITGLLARVRWQVTCDADGLPVMEQHHLWSVCLWVQLCREPK